MRRTVSFVKSIVCFLLILALFFVMTYAEQIGLGNALMYSGKTEKFIALLESEDYYEASEYLSFYGRSNVRNERNKWAEKMETSGIIFKKIECGKMYPDDGIAKCYATATLDNEEVINFHIIVQGNGLALLSVNNANNGAGTLYSRMLNTYNPG